LDGKKSVRRSIEKDLMLDQLVPTQTAFAGIAVPSKENLQYGLAFEAGLQLAQNLSLNGAQDILQEAKLQVEQMRVLD